jgi:hypothetical protein
VNAPGQYEETTRCWRCQEKFRRPRGATYDACLGCQTSQRLIWSGFTSDSPELIRIREWNAAVFGQAAEPDR